MPLPTREETPLVVGKGRLFLETLDPVTLEGEGEVFVGNVPSFNMSRAITRLEHRKSTDGLNEKDRSIVTARDYTATYTTDAVTAQNIANMWAGTIDDLTVAAVVAPGLTETFKVFRGRSYQLGKSDTFPTGRRMLDTLVVTAGATPVVATGNYNFDEETGRLEIYSDAPDVDAAGEDWTFTYGQEAHARKHIVSGGDQLLVAVRFISDNPVGPQHDYYAPYAALTSEGDFALIGESWQELGFNLEILKKSDREKLYIDGRADV